MYCSTCGKELRGNVKFCTHCGAPLEGTMVVRVNPATKQETAPPIPKDRKKKKKGLILIIIVLIVLILAVSATAFWFAGGKDIIYDMIGKTEQSSDDSDHDKKNNSNASGSAVKKSSSDKEKDASEEPTEEPTASAEPTSEPVVSAEPTNEVAASAEPTASVSAPATSPEEALQNYVGFFVNAVNTGDYTGAENTMLAGSAIYNSQKQVVADLYQRGVKEELQTCQAMETHRISDRVVEITSREIIDVYYADGTQKSVQQSYIYTCESTENGYLLTNMREVQTTENNVTENKTTEKQTVSSGKKKASSNSYILPDINNKIYSMKKLRSLGKKKLRLARNELYARHGYIFKDRELRAYFKSKSWYVPVKKDVRDSAFNYYELKNLRRIQKCERK